MTISTTLGGVRRAPLGLLAAATALTGLVFPAASQAILGPPIRQSSELWTPVSGSVFDQSTSESVAIQSNLHLVWRPDGSGGGTLEGNVADSTATGLDSGNNYSFTGADTVTIVGPPIAPITVNFGLAQGPPIRDISGPPIREVNGPPIRITVAVQLTFNDSGQLASASAQIGRHSF